MKKKALALVSLVTAGMFALSACGGGGGRGDASEGPSSEAGFAADAVIGVSLPWLGTQNWKESEVYFNEQLKEAGFEPLVQAADNKVPSQQQQIEAMIERGAEVIVVGAVDGTQLSSVLEKAKAEGIAVLGVDRLIENTEAVDGVVQFGSVRTGELQGQSLLDGLAELKGEGPYNIELFGGGPADPNAPDFFNGAMSVLQPKIDDGTLNVVSGQLDFAQAATQDWDNSKAQARMDSLLSGFYSDKEIHGVLAPNDGIARAILTSAKNAGQELPVVDGLDAENESIVSIWAGEQYSTVGKPSADLVAKTVELIQILQKGEALPAPDDKVDNGKFEAPIYQLDPVIITKANIEEFFADDPERLALLK